MAEQDWFRHDEELVLQLQACHRLEEPLPRVQGYGDLVALESGGQGSVYLATEARTGRRVALKVFHAQSFDSAAGRRRFEREITLVSRLDHPNIVRLHRFGHCEDGRAFLVMEYIRGRGLGEHTEDCDSAQVLELMLQLATALDHAHRRGVIHRDLKPGNVRVDTEGRARLLDFGLAKPRRTLKPEGEWELSATGQFLGSLRWASPEQLRGHPDEVDTGTDIYGLGLLLFHGLTGEMPYDTSGSVAEVAHQIQHSSPTRLRSLRPDLGSDLETVILRCLSKQATRRYASMGDLARDLEHLLEGSPIEARRDGIGFVLSSLCRKHPWSLTAAVFGLLALITFSIVTTSYYLRVRDAESAGRIALIEKQAALDAKRAEVEKVEAVNEFLLGSFLGRGVPAGQLGDLRLQEVLTEASDRIESEPSLRQRPGVRADLHVAFAYWFSVLPDRYDEAIAHASDALQLYASEREPSLIQQAWAHEVRGSVLLSQRQFRQAQTDLQAALSVYREAGADELNIARLSWLVVRCGLALDDLDGLEDLLLDAEQIFARQLGAEHQNVRSMRSALEQVRAQLITR